MTDNKRNIDEFFQEEFGNATEMPPSSVWETLEKRLDQQRPDSKKRFWWVYLLVLSMFIGGSIAAYLSNNKIENAPETPASEKLKNTSNTNNQHLNSAETSTPNSIEENAGNNLGQNEIKNTADSKYLNESATKANTKNKSEKAGLSMPAKNTTSGNTNNKKINNESLSDHNQNSASGNSRSKTLSNSDLDKPTDNSTSVNIVKSTGKKSGLIKSSQRNNPGNIRNQNNNGEASSAANISGNNSVNNPDNSTDNSQNSTKKSKTVNNPNASSNNSETKDNKSEENNSQNKKTIANRTKTNNPKTVSNKSTSDKLNKSGKKTESDEVSSMNPKSEPGNGSEKVLSSGNTSNKSITKPPATTGNLKQQSKPKKIVENKTETRGLSGVPDDFEDDIKDEPSKMVDIYDNQSENKENDASEALEPKASLENKIQKSRASDPLSGAPIPVNVLNENDAKANSDSKKESSESGGAGGATAAPRDKTKRSLNMTIGIKAGYEQGFANYTSSKFVGSAFGEVNFSKKISFILQPGIKFGNTNKEYGSVLSSFIDAGATTRNEYNIKIDTTTGMPTGFSDFAFQQNYDSIVASVLAERRFVEIEVPFLFRFKVDNSFSLLAGMNFTFGKIISSTSSLNRMSGLNMKDTIFNYNTKDSTKPVPSAPGIFSHTGTPAFSTYKDPGSSSPISPFRFGYSLGFSYTYKQRLMLDVMIQQNLSGLSNITDAEIKKIFSQPYVRLSLGCIIFGSKKQ